MKDKINIAAFLCAILCFFCLATFLPVDEKTIEIENRNLNTITPLRFSSVFSGEFVRSLEGFLSDRVSLRTRFIQAAEWLQKGKGFRTAQIVNNSILVLDDTLMEIFKSNPEAEAAYANTLNAYAASLQDYENVNLYSLLIPTRIAFMEEKYARLADSQKDTIDTVNSRLQDKITAVDCYTILSAHKDAYIYFRSDHHWTALGSYYAYTAFAKQAGFTPMDLNAFEKVGLNGFLGYLYNQAPNDRVKANPDDIVYYTPKEPVTTSEPVFILPQEGEALRYSLFTGVDRALVHYETSVKNGKTAVLIKDSYGNCFAPWLIQHYENVLLIDPRAFDASVTEELRKYEAVDLIFINYVFTTTFGDFVERIDAIR